MKTTITASGAWPRSASSITFLQRLHTSRPLTATPIPHPAAPGPPPKPPVPAAFAPEERIDRKRRQAELLKLGQNLRANPTQGTTILKKRFWKDVSVKETPDGYQIMLDARPVRDPQTKSVLVVPLSKPHLATAIALEWDLLVSAHQAIRNHYVPLTSLLARALDIQTADAAAKGGTRETIMKMLMGYLHTDTLLCWAPEKGLYDGKTEGLDKPRGSLRQLQMNTAAPILENLTSRVWPGVELKPILGEDSILPSEQPQETIEAIRAWVMSLPPFELAALERGALASKSLLVAARLLVDWSSELANLRPDEAHAARFNIEDAAEACSLEVAWQTGMWGEVEDTHDVEKEDLRRQLGSVILLVQSTMQS